MSDTVDLRSAGLRPGVLRMLNWLWPSDGQLNADKLIRSAVKRVGMHDFGDNWSDEALFKLVDSINAEASLNTVGKFIMAERLKGALVTRLRAVDILKSRPEILEQEVAPIWLVTGLQRTGTTYLQRLLGGDPYNRSLYSWESLDPVPNDDRFETRRRIRKARFSERALRWISPGFFAIHPIDHLGPEEDVLLLDPTFLSTAPEAMMHVPTFGHWLEEQDHTKAYAWEKKMLQLLQWQRPAKRWILKSPHHLEHVDAFFKVFPKTNVIWTHRDPMETLPSFMSMVYHGRAMFSQNPSIDEVREHWLRKSRLMVSSVESFRQKNADRIINVLFDELVTEPLEVVRSIYKSCGLTLSESGSRGVGDVISRHKRDRFGIHTYDAETFRLREETVKHKFQDYYTLLNSLNAG